MDEKVDREKEIDREMTIWMKGDKAYKNENQKQKRTNNKQVETC